MSDTTIEALEECDLRELEQHLGIKIIVAYVYDNPEFITILAKDMKQVAFAGRFVAYREEVDDERGGHSM